MKERVFEGVDRVTGTLDHANSLSMYLCLIGPIFVAAANSTLPRLVRWFSIVAIAATAVGSLLTVSRAGVPIFGLVMLGATVMCVSWRITLKKVAATALIALCIGGLFYKAWPSLKARYEEATLEEEYLDKQGEGRGYYLRLAKAIMQDRFFGIGLNNWSYWVSKKYGARIGTAYEDYDLHPPVDRETWSDPHFAAPAHNLGALTVGELGVPGLILFGLMWARWFGMGSRFLWQRTPAAMQRLGVGLFFGTCGISLQSLTEWTYRQTHIYMTFHILLGALASLHYARCRSRRQPATAPVEAVSSPKYEFADAVAGRC